MGAGRGQLGRWARRGALLALLLAACRPPPPPPGKPLVIGTPGMAAVGLLDIAARHGELAREGLSVELRAFPSGRDALEALVAGKLDVAACFDTPLVLAAARHPGLRVLTSLHHASRNTVLVARRDRGIRSAEDLRGRRVGVPRATNAAFFLDTLLAFGGVAREEVTQVDLAPEGAPEALARGEVDAVAIWYPEARRAREALPPGEAVEIPAEVYTEMSMLVVREDLLSARGAELTRLLRALSAAEHLAENRPAEAFAALRSAHPREREDDLREDWARGHPGLGLTNVLLTVLERESRWVLRAQGRTGPGPDFREFLAPGPLSAADPEVVTVHAPLPPPLEEGESP